MYSSDSSKDRAADKDRAASPPPSPSGRRATAGEVEDAAGDVDPAERRAGESPGDTPGDASGSGDPGGAAAAAGTRP